MAVAHCGAFHARRVSLLGILGLAFCFSAPAALAQSRIRPEPQYPREGQPDQAEGRRVLEEFRKLGIAGDYVLEFTLRVMPRRGADRRVDGRLYGTRTGDGPLSLMDFTPGAEGPRRVLVQNGPRPQVWTVAGDGAQAVAIGPAQLFEPLAGTALTPFDLQMPFIYWDDIAYEGVIRLSNRPTHQFLVYPPAAVAAVRPDLTGVRFYLDTQYSALVQVEQLGPEKSAVKTMSMRELKKTQDQWIPRAIDLRDERTRDKTRFLVNAAALNLSLAPAMFQPANLSSPPVPVDRTRFEVFP